MSIRARYDFVDGLFSFCDIPDMSVCGGDMAFAIE